VLFRAQSWVAGLRGIDRVRVDQLLGLLVLIAIELEAWFGSPSDGRALPAVAGVLLSAAVAVRRRWPLGGILVVLVAWTVGVVLGSRGGLQGAPLVVPITLLFYGLGAFAAERPSVWVLDRRRAAGFESAGDRDPGAAGAVCARPHGARPSHSRAGIP
jgi:hypothetical protein